MKTSKIFTTPEGNFTIPQEWRSMLGIDVLEGRKTVKARLKELEISMQTFRVYIAFSQDYAKWYNPAAQRLLGLRQTSKSVDEIKAKRAATNLERYGTTNPTALEQFISKRKATLKARSGFEYPNMRSSEDLKRLLEEIGVKPLETITSQKGGILYEAQCLFCGKIFKFHFNKGNPTKCPYCQNTHSTKLEESVRSLISSLGLEVMPHFYTKALNRKEIDIYVPQLKLGIEVNGALTHNAGYNPFNGIPKDKDYHALKTQRALSAGIQLIHVWEHWEEKKTLSLIRAKIGKPLHTIFARKLSYAFIKGINPQVDAFYINSHLRGTTKYSATLVLMQGTKIVQALSYLHKEDELLIVRNASALDTSIIGGFARLFSHLKEIAVELKITSIVTYADRDLTPLAENSVYFRNGFSIVGDSGPTMSYYAARKVEGFYKQNEVINRRELQKHKLKEMFSKLGKPFFDSKTEIVNLASLSIFPIYNSGCWKFIYHIDPTKK